MAGIISAPVFGLPWAPTAPPFPTPERLVHHHAHNDYRHEPPLLDALRFGYTSIEVDLWRTFEAPDHLLVGQWWGEVSPPPYHRTLQALYLDPLRAHLEATGGEVFPSCPGQTLQLVIDIKNGAGGVDRDDETARRRLYDYVEGILAGYADILTEYGPEGVVRQGPVHIVLTGERPSLEHILRRPSRFSAGDGILSFLNADDPDFTLPAALVPIISGRYELNFRYWTGMDRDEIAKLARIYDLAAQTGQRVRFWGGPTDRPTWERLLSPIGHDPHLRRSLPILINVDALGEFRTFIYPEEATR